MNKKVIILVAAVAVAAAIGVIMWITSLDKAKETALPKNQFTAKIEQEIEQFSRKPDSKFCKDYYSEVAYHINDFYKQNRFGNNQSENDQWKENLEKNLYSTYSDKFIKQAFTVFRGSEWKSADLKFIQAEKNDLKKSQLLVAGSPVDKEFTKIQTALNKYNEIVGFISSCKDLSYSGSSLSDRFPIADVQSKIRYAVSLQQNRLENDFVNNCSRLHDGLKSIPQSLFREHVRYLDNKINNWSGLYSNYNSQSDYSNNLYKPLKSEIEALDKDKDIYNVSNFDSEYKRLSDKWSADNTKAYNYSYPTR
ncbi:hypothetical protein SAMD00024442_11_48 [Candidatus Symbiothrix dinenymphae]|nr:hypothetical protein SAMD00024442_11_48 [Candidatus Symbiothrix dinenymphae]